jgi:translation initiation factor IF-2
VQRRASRTQQHDASVDRRRGDAFSAKVKAILPTPRGVVLGCVVDEGTIENGMVVEVTAGEHRHTGTVVMLRRFGVELEKVSQGEFGVLIEPPYVGPLPERLTS